ncbi:MAG: hypothetical protein GEU79_11670 [Acidimicrobiia bacterium]|nr:hypothetical protein [Acidimicrobiia bacterium]
MHALTGVFAQVAFTVESGLLLLMVLIVVGPLLAERVRIPGLVGLIALGTVFGPSVLEWLRPEGIVASVGKIGLLYLMFLAGMELDLKTFMANRRAAITFGLLTFVFPFALSLAVGVWIVDAGITAAVLLGAMWASHTLVAYPEVKRAGVEANRSVGLSVSATVITDVLALLVLGFSVSGGHQASSEMGESPLLPLWLGVIVLGTFCLWLLPRMADWFFSHLGRTRIQRFVFVLAGMSAGAVVSLVGGIEGLVGAFLAGIGLNRLVPAEGELMDSIEFFGGALFVPAFLVSVGMSVDPRSMAEPSTIGLALVFTGVVVTGKTLAAVVTGRIFDFDLADVGMMTALTTGQAAATLAIAQVGLVAGIFDQSILDAAVLTVVLTVVITSLATRYFAKKVSAETDEEGNIGSRVLLQVRRGRALEGAIELGIAIAREDDGLLTPFVVCEEDGYEDSKGIVDEAVELAVERGHDAKGITRVSSSQVRGAVDLIVEEEASSLIVPWEGPGIPGKLFGDEIESIGESSPVPVLAAKIHSVDWQRVIVATGRSRGMAARRKDIALCLDIARRLGTEHSIDVVVHTAEPSLIDDPDNYSSVESHQSGTRTPFEAVGSDDLLVVPAHVVSDQPTFGTLRHTGAMGGASLLIVAGPGRLKLTSGSHPDRVMGTVGPTRRVSERPTRVAKS